MSGTPKIFISRLAVLYLLVSCTPTCIKHTCIEVNDCGHTCATPVTICLTTGLSHVSENIRIQGFNLMNEVISFIDSVNLISKYNHSDLNNSTCLCWETAGAVIC